MEKDEKYLTLEEAAAILKFDKLTVRRWILEGKLKGARVGGHSWRIKRSDLDEFAATDKELQYGKS